jgi:hypothetical protein
MKKTLYSGYFTFAKSSLTLTISIFFCSSYSSMPSLISLNVISEPMNATLIFVDAGLLLELLLLGCCWSCYCWAAAGAATAGTAGVTI